MSPTPTPTETYSSAAPQPKQSLLGVGGPLFNAMLVMTLMAISFAAVALPERPDDLAAGEPDSSAPVSTVELSLPEPTASVASTTSTTIDSGDTSSALLGTLSTSDQADEEFDADAVPEPEPTEAPGSTTTLPTSNPEPQLTQVTFDPAPTVQEVERVVYRTERVIVEVPASTIPRRPECGDFNTRPEAQAAFDAHPDTLSHFDGDGDGLACEQLVDPTRRLR